MDDSIADLVSKLKRKLSNEIVGEATRLAADAVWDYHGYTGPGACEGVFLNAHLINVLEWYEKACKACDEGDNIPLPPVPMVSE